MVDGLAAMVDPGAVIVSDNTLEVVALLESLTVTVTEYADVLPVPDAGVPLSTPLRLRASPFGNPIADQV